MMSDDFIVERREEKKAKFSLLDRIYVEKGDRSDWNEFHALHYKAESLGLWPRFYRIGLDGDPIGCIVFTIPRITIAGRNTLLKNFAPNKDGMDTTIMNKHKAKWLNAHSATLSRIVLDTTFRGVGVAYRAMNLAMRMTGLDFVEFQSSMSRVNPFAQKAGIVFGKPKRTVAYNRGLILFRRWFESIPTDYVSIYEEYSHLTEREKARCLEDMRAFYFKNSCKQRSGDRRFDPRSVVDAVPVPQLIKNLQQLVFAYPMYGVYINPDKGRTFPDRLYINLYDSNELTKPLDLGRQNG